ncbi:MAG: ERAP1-like C-terminal domain-containing protein, partial [Actinomycetota bacterium]|nr:ERAP1-like C-terminal domain-containing protein [Actinomycetota bacterium]
AKGTVHAARCRASRPDPAAKRHAWQLVTGDRSADNYAVYATCEGFWQPEQHAVTASYVERYFTEIPATAGLRSGWVVGESARLAFPRYAVSAATLSLADKALAGELDPAVRRAITDCADDLRRAVAVRATFGG